MTSTSDPRPELAYYTAANAPFFVGLVGLLSSLRAVGEDAPVFVVDCGLTESQRARLSKHVTFLPQHRELHAEVQKATGALSRPADIMVIIDADMLVTRRFTPLIAEATKGQLVAFEDSAYPGRFFPEWSSLGLGTPVRRTYVNAGLMILSNETASEFLPLFIDLHEKLDTASVRSTGAPVSSPFHFHDQDILNAMLCTVYERRASRHSRRLAPFPPFSGIEVSEGNPVACRYADGAVPYVLHHIHMKPWLTTLHPTPYSEFLTSVVTSADAPVRLGSKDLPLRLRNSRLASIAQRSVYLRGRLGLRPAIERRVRALKERSRSVS